MALRRGTPLTFRPSGCADAVDGTNAPPGAMKQLANLVPDPSSRNIFVPRPAIFKLFDFKGGGFNNPGFVSSLQIIGNIAYGTLLTVRNPGHDEPYAVNLATQAALTINGITAANTPASPPQTGPWTPPIVAQVGSRILFTHPGFPGGATKFGWLDVSGFTTTFTASTHSNTTLDGFTTSLGVQPGMTVTGTGIPAGTTVVSSTTSSITMSQAATATGSPSVTVAGGTPLNPLWGAGDTDRNPLPSVPLGVAQFNGRAYYALGTNGIVASDPLFACRVSNSPDVQALTTGDGLAVTAVAPLMLSAPIVTTGIVAALLAFEGVTRIQQITGDPSLGNWAMNALPVMTGTAAPLSLATCELGTAFLSPEGLRIVQFSGQVTPPLGDAGNGITLPFIFTRDMSRMCAAAGSDTIRVTAENAFMPPSSAETVPQPQEWWFDLTRKIWTGPHSMVPSLIAAWAGLDNQNTFVMIPQLDNPGPGTLWGTAVFGADRWGLGLVFFGPALWQADPYPDLDSSFIENGQTMNWVYQPTPLPDTGEMTMIDLVEMAMAGAFADQNSTAVANDIDGTGLDTTLIPATPLRIGSLWGQATWGQNLWGGGSSQFQQWPVYWHHPIVFKQLDIAVTGTSGYGVRVGNMYLRYQPTRYPLPVPPEISAPAPRGAPGSIWDGGLSAWDNGAALWDVTFG